MVAYRLGHAARILGVSVDTVRRLADDGKLKTTRSKGGQRLVDGARLAKLAETIDDDPAFAVVSSARNHLLGIVTRVVRDKVAAQVELRCGPFRLVALVTRESVDAMKLQPGTMAYAVVKATNVVVELADAAVAAMAGDGDAPERSATRRRGAQ
ncbi:MAG: helix-turn-helix domain-containing protein [Planctomycetes bacterium]|nr:helix-turn-helix domain-containing protein [Planctomycetota bacterium]